jgi:hypothetical protein
MILRFDLKKCLRLHRQEKLDSWAIDPNGEKYATPWIKFMVEVIRSSQPGYRVDFSFVDRTGAVPSIVKNHIFPEQLIPIGPPEHWDFFDICMTRAQELLATNRHVTVLWSGGLDSTLALFSLMRQAQNLDQISVQCTFESIVESGKIFDSLIKDSGVRIKFDQTRTVRNLPYSYDQEDPTQLYVTGGCGDQLFGKPVSLQSNSTSYTDPWYTGFGKDYLDIIEPSIQFSERPINTVRDLRWWVFFNHTWTTAMYDDLIEKPAHVCQRIRSFYATPEFQRWAIHTPSYYEDQDKYRWPAKQALSRLIDYPYYIQHKTKSMGYTWKYSPNWYMLDKDFKTYHQSN